MSLFTFGFTRKDGKNNESGEQGNQEKDDNQTNSDVSMPETAKERYEGKRKMLGRGFRKEWINEFNWLEYNEDEGKMICKICREFPNIAEKSSPFFNGSNSFHMSNIKGHDQSHRHARCIEEKKKLEKYKKQHLFVLESETLMRRPLIN